MSDSCTNDRPEDCDCTEPRTDTELPCHACFQAGFTSVNPEVR